MSMMVARERLPLTSGVQPSSVVSSVTSPPASEAPRDRGRHGIAEPPPRGESVVHDRRVVAAGHHAGRALLVADAPPIVFPPRGLEQLLEGRGVSFLQEVAGPLPAEYVVRRVAPRSALEVLLAHEELQEQRRLVEPPAALGIREDLREELVRALAHEDEILIRGLGVAVAGRDHHALDAQVHHLVEELSHPERAYPVEESRVGGDPEAAAERFLDGGDGLDVDAVA